MYLGNEISCLLWHMTREMEVNLGYSVVSILASLSFKRRRPNQKFVTQDSKTPDVNLCGGIAYTSRHLGFFSNLLIVLFLFHHLWREVVQRPTDSIASRGGSMNWPAKVGNLDVALHAYQKVLRFDVPVNDFLGVAVGKGMCKLSYVLKRGGGEKEGGRGDGRKKEGWKRGDRGGERREEGLLCAEDTKLWQFSIQALQNPGPQSIPCNTIPIQCCFFEQNKENGLHLVGLPTRC